MKIGLLRCYQVPRWMNVIPCAAALAIAIWATTGSAFACLVAPGGNPINDWSQIFKDCTKLIALSPRLAVGYSNRAQAYLYGKGDLDRAEADADKCITLHQSDPGKNALKVILATCHLTKGDIYRKRRQSDDALSSYKAAWKLAKGRLVQSRLITSYSERAEDLWSKAEYRAAIANYEAIYELLPVSHDPVSLDPSIVRLIASYERIGDLNKAIAVSTDFIGRNPAYADAYFLRGRVQFALGRIDAALSDFEQALRHEPKEPEYLLARGTAEIELGRVEAAVADFNSVIANKPSARAFVQRGLAYESQGKTDAALGDLTEAIKRDRESSAAYFNRAVLLAAKKDLSGAIADFSEAIRTDPRNPIYFAMRGTVHLAQGSYDKALADYAEAIRLDPEHAQHYTMRAWAAFKIGKNQSGLDDANRALALAPNSATALATRAHIYEVLGNRSAAVADFNSALDIFPEMTDARQSLIRLKQER